MGKRLGCASCWPDSRTNGKRGIGTRMLPLLADAIDGTGNQFRRFNDHFLEARIKVMVELTNKFHCGLREDIVLPYLKMVEQLLEQYHDVKLVKRKLCESPESRSLWNQMDEVEKQRCIEVLQPQYEKA